MNYQQRCEADLISARNRLNIYHAVKNHWGNARPQQWIDECQRVDVLYQAALREFEDQAAYEHRMRLDAFDALMNEA